MLARTLWLWLSVGWLTEAVLNPSSTPICDSGGPCTCTHGKLTCDCSTSFLKEVVLKRSALEDSTSSISVANCFHLHVSANALSGLSALTQVFVTDVKLITLEEKAFNWTSGDHHHTGLSINISNCNIRQFPSYSVEGYIRDFLLSSVNISNINTYAFNSLDRADRIEFSRVNIAEAETQSFKKIGVEFLTILDSNLSSLPERTMIDVTVRQEVRIERVKINRLEKSSLRVDSSRNFRLIKCTIGRIESNAFEVRTKGDVSIHDNVFSYVGRHAFSGISVDDKYLKEAGKQDFVFENNTIIEFENESLKLNITGFDPRLDWIMLKQKCSCDAAKTWVDSLVIYSNGYTRKQPSVDRLIYCLNPNPTRLFDLQRLHCNTTRFSVLTVVVVVVAVVVALSVIVLIVYCAVRRRGKKYINVPTSASNLRPPGDKPHMLVVPDGKTYRETELHVIFEHADGIKTTNFVKARPDGDAND